MYVSASVFFFLRTDFVELHVCMCVSLLKSAVCYANILSIVYKILFLYSLNFFLYNAS
jgi:hypothetical protein